MLSTLPKNSDPKLIVGFDTADDAAVYKINDDTAIIQTVDFFPPMVDDPYTFGQVAAANALSDIYAMGGTPKLALNLFCFPSKKLPQDAIKAILAGGADKVLEAGAILCGGHTIEDPEPKYGLAVTGFVRPDKVLSNSSAKDGDLLILTKAIGSGVLTTAAKAQLLSGEYEKSLIAAMTALNAKAQQSMLKYEVNSCTDITGFGLILPGALEFANMGIIPAGAYRNREFIEDKVSICETVNRAVSDILFDPQTSGGLLISLPENQAHRLLDDIKAHTPDAAIIGCIKAKGEHAIEVV